jgi:hypothetical protein
MCIYCLVFRKREERNRICSPVTKWWRCVGVNSLCSQGAERTATSPLSAATGSPLLISSFSGLTSSVGDPDPYGFGPQVLIGLRILPSSCKNSKKNLDFYCFLTSLWLGPPGSAFGSIPKCHGSPKLLTRLQKGCIGTQEMDEHIGELSFYFSYHIYYFFENLIFFKSISQQSVQIHSHSRLEGMFPFVKADKNPLPNHNPGLSKRKWIF